MRQVKVLGMLALLVSLCWACTTKGSDIARVPVGYVTKVTCSEVFLAGRDAGVVAETNFDGISSAFNWVSIKVSGEDQKVAGHLFGLGRATATFTEEAGCRLDPRTGLDALDARPATDDYIATSAYDIDIAPDVQTEVMALFDDPSLQHPILSRGVVVVQGGVIVGEHYKDGFDQTTRQQSWSMAKGAMQAMIGIAVGENLLAVDDADLLSEWTGSDPRRAITLENLLQMKSGLTFSEDYANPLSDVDQMLFNSADMGAFAASKPLEAAPGTHFQYSSGTTNIVSLILRRRMASAGLNYHAFPYTHLFGPIGMGSAIFETDPSGTFIGSSYIYATPRDFARFGQLYLQDGVWNEARVLPEGWVDYTSQPVEGSGGMYGSHWSLNIGQSNLPGMPEDVIYLGGNDGQFIFVIPSKNAVIVRMGVMRAPATFEDDLYPLIRAVFDVL